MKTTIQAPTKSNSINSFATKISSSDKIVYLNEFYSKKCGYEVHDLIDKPIDALFHADMPKVILRMLSNRLKKGKSMQLFHKNATKQGGHFWTYSIFSVNMNVHKSITSYTCKSAYIKINEKDKISKLYNILSKIEEKKHISLEVSKRYLIGYLENKKTNYNELVENLFLNSVNKIFLTDARSFIESSTKSSQPVNDISANIKDALTPNLSEGSNNKVKTILLKGA